MRKNAKKRTKFRPCIDIHQGKVKQIVGGSLKDSGKGLITNFVSEQSPAYFAKMYKKDQLQGGHIIMLGPDNEDAAIQALKAWPQGMQIGGGINLENASFWIEQGASHVIVTSWIFKNNSLNLKRLEQLHEKVGREHLVLDLSCRKTSEGWNVAINRWQTITPVQIIPKTLDLLAEYCDEFLIHAADVEGKQQGMDEDLIKFLAEYCPIPVTYAGGGRSIDDLRKCNEISQGLVDLTIGSALDIFGGKGAKYEECVRYNQGKL
ncbi:MAG: phosphoribosylformimino-5-aminoimidazole carboxamide ribotide isomerase [Fibrobacter sp.]|nr:phosphoribosylformimino-5-aminoimidazole carboxamide ribotide isomerase [Fibrobacter sp.]